MVTISGKARLAGVLGWPVTHSRSPLLHNYWFERHAVDGAYVPLGVGPDDLPVVMRALPRMGFLGCNLTMPHKEAVLPLLDRLAPAAAAIGAVNTVLIEQDGTLTGHNTDGVGFLAHLEASVPGWRRTVRRVVLLGAGGAAKALAVAFIDAGIDDVMLVNRTIARAEELLDRLDHKATTARPAGWEGVAAALAGADLLVNTTSLGMTGQPPLMLDLAPLPAAAIVADIVYSPLVTPLLQAAAGRGHRTVDGLGMLLHQAVPGFAHWGGVRPTVDAATRRLLEGAVTGQG